MVAMISHATFIMYSVAVSSDAVNLPLGVVMVGFDMVYTWYKASVALENKAMSMCQFCLHGVSIVTTALLIGLADSFAIKMVGLVSLVAGGLCVAEFRGLNVTQTSRLSCCFVLLVDAIPLFVFAIASAQGNSFAVPLVLLCFYKTIVCLWFFVLARKANWGNDSDSSWIDLSSREFQAVCGLVLCHLLITLISCIRGVQSDSSSTCIGRDNGGIGGDILRCASPADMAVVDVGFSTAIVAMIMLFVGEFFNRTSGDADAVWDNSCTLVVAETSLQVLLSGQVFYSILRLLVDVDGVYICFVTLDLAWIFTQMLTRQWREGWPLQKMDWLPVFVLEVWDVINSLAVTVSLASDGYSTSIVNSYVVCTCLTLFLFQVTYPFWKNLKTIALLSCFNDLVTDGPMLYIMVANELWDDNAVRSIAAFVNVCLISVGVLLWPLKYLIKAKYIDAEEDTPPAPDTSADAAIAAALAGRP